MKRTRGCTQKIRSAQGLGLHAIVRPTLLFYFPLQRVLFPRCGRWTLFFFPSRHMSNQLEKAEREARLEAERQAKTAKMHKRFSINALDEDKAPFVPPPPPPPPPSDGSLASCFKSCLPPAQEPATPPSTKKGSSRQTVSRTSLSMLLSAPCLA